MRPSIETSIEICSEVLAERIGAAHCGKSQFIAGLVDSREMQSGWLSYVKHPKTITASDDKACSVLLIATKHKESILSLLPNVTLLISDKPRLALARITKIIYESLRDESQEIQHLSSTAVIGTQCSIAKSAYISDYVVLGNNIKIGEKVFIGAHSVIGNNTTIGDHTRIGANVVLYENINVGAACIIHAGAVIGSDGFGFEINEQHQWEKIYHLGGLTIGDNVEIGANVTIDRATMGKTVIEDGVKLDNLVHIAHNVQLKRNCIMAGQSGVAGGVIIGENSIIGGQTAIADVETPPGTIIGGKTGISKNNQDKLKSGVLYVSALIAQPSKTWHKITLLLNKLPELFKRVQALEEKNQ